MKRNPVKNQQQKQTNIYFWFIWYIMIFINFERKMIEQSICRIFKKKHTNLAQYVWMLSFLLIHSLAAAANKQKHNKIGIKFDGKQNEDRDSIHK